MVPVMDFKRKEKTFNVAALDSYVGPCSAAHKLLRRIIQKSNKVVEMLWNCCQNAVKMLSKCCQMLSKLCRNLVKIFGHFTSQWGQWEPWWWRSWLRCGGTNQFPYFVDGDNHDDDGNGDISSTWRSRSCQIFEGTLGCKGCRSSWG